jgi:hypothetical protein
MKNLRIFNALRQERYNAKLGIAFVAMKSNVRQLARLPHFISVNKIDDVNISNVYPPTAMRKRRPLSEDRYTWASAPTRRAGGGQPSASPIWTGGP